jgi:2-methylisocitrate lyase-like PEP mutase family enzyme
MATNAGDSSRINVTRDTFRALHEKGFFVMPNPWDIGSAKLLASLGFKALATTSSGHAASLGRTDQHVTRDELLAHVAAITNAVDVPINVDAERCFADTLDGVAETVGLLAEAGSAGCSIEDYDPAAGAIEDFGQAVDRVRAAAESAHRHGVMLTARAENHLYRANDLDDTIRRLTAYRDAGADVLYAPGLIDLDEIRRVVTETGAPINVLALPRGPSTKDLAEAGVRRVSTGGSLAWAAYGAMVRGALELLEQGTSTYASNGLTRKYLDAFNVRPEP